MLLVIDVLISCAMHYTCVEDSLDSLRTWLPVSLSDTFLLEGTLVNRDDDDPGEQKLG